MKKKSLFLLLILLPFLLQAKPPDLSPKEVKTKVEEILKAHVCHKELSSELILRTFKNFLEELDPTKTYFLKEEVAEWETPSEELIQRGLLSFKSGNFSVFEELYTTFLATIDRRAKIEGEIAGQKLEKGVRNKEFKDLDWANSYEELFTRNLRIKSLQVEAGEKLREEGQAKLLQRLNKRRLHREKEMMGSNEEERFQLALSYLLKALTSALDSHTNYFTPKEANQFMIQVQQRLFGIGAQLRDDLDGLSVVRILENSPASQSNKLKINDKIIGVNHEPIVGMDISEAVELIRGEKGTRVILSVLRELNEAEAEMIDVELMRNEVVLEETRLETKLEPYGDGVIAVLKLFSFYQDPNSSSSSDILKALKEIKGENKLKGVILDLRSNAGGLLTQAVKVTGLFIKKGIVVSIKDHQGKIQHLREIDGNPAWEGPLFVLVNQASASAAEIVAQTLQDYGRALVVGDEHTFGKGSFQTFTLDPLQHPKVNPRGEYKVTRGKYYTVSGKSPQLHGVLADIVIPGILSELDIGEKFSKFPLENDAIDPHFDDDLSDVSPFHRFQLGQMYKYNLQPKLTSYQPFIFTLKKNSKTRIENNENYQGFLKELKSKNFDSSSIELSLQSDLQLCETLSTLKDLIYLMDLQQTMSAACNG